MTTTTGTEKYGFAEFTCNHCQQHDKLDIALIRDLVASNPIKCSKCRTMVQLGIADHKALEKHYNKGERLGKMAFIVALPFFAVTLVLSLMFGAIATIPCVLTGLLLGAMLKGEFSSLGVVSLPLEPASKIKDFSDLEAQGFTLY